MSGLSSVYPPPPWYYKHFTNKNLETLKQLQAKDESPSFPLNLLIPPEPPSDQAYRSFGNIWQADDKLLSLTDAGIKQLYKEIGPDPRTGISSSHQDRIWELKKLLKSLLISFLDLVGIMSIAPENFPAKVEDMRIILINMHHLLNEYRPHQSRESLILIMEDQIQKKKTEIDTLRKSNAAIRERIFEMADHLRLADVQTDNQDSENDTKEINRTQQRDLLLWRLLGDDT
jgi:mediator of RNA polymerase II transcription subunit 7